jgi:hypothetical protein
MKCSKKESGHQITLCPKSVLSAVVHVRCRAEQGSNSPVGKEGTFQVFIPAVAWVPSYIATPSRHLTDQSEDPYVKIKETPISAW